MSQRRCAMHKVGAAVWRFVAVGLITLLLPAHLAFAASALDEACAALVARADAQSLADDPTWWQLLHYTRSPWAGVRSSAHSPEFFVSPEGAAHPREELVAMLTAVCPALLGGPMTASARAVLCMFPARYSFLAQHLSSRTAFVMETQACPEFAAWQRRFAQASISLVFAAGDMQRPSTFFGHTFLRLESAVSSSELLAHAVSFSVAPSDQNRAAFVAQALVGTLDGVFDVAPYYHHVQRYGQLQARDLWTYQLELSASARTRFIAHLWEVRQTRFAYRFFDANCASSLLTLLDVAVPQTGLAAQLGLYAIPLDAVHIVGHTPSLWSRVAFRPALATQAQATLQALSPQALASAKRLATIDDAQAWRTLTTLADADKSEALRAAEMLLRLRYGSNVLADARPQTRLAAMRTEAVLQAQAQHTAEPRPQVSLASAAPHRGHRTTRMATGIALQQRDVYTEWGMRAALHDVLDTSVGFDAWATLEVMNLQLRVAQSAAAQNAAPVQLGLDVLRASALRPFTPWSKPVSWRGALGVQPRRWAQAQPLWASTLAPLSLQLELGLGISLSPLGSRTQLYYAFGDVRAASELTRSAQHVLQVQAALGGVWRWHSRVNAQVELRAPFDVWGQSGVRRKTWLRWELWAGMHVALSPRLALRAQLGAGQAHRGGCVLALLYF